MKIVDKEIFNDDAEKYQINELIRSLGVTDAVIRTTGFRSLTNCAVYEITYRNLPSVIKIEKNRRDLSESYEIENNLAGYNAMPGCIRPVIYSHNTFGPLKYIIMEKAGISLFDLLTVSEYTKQISTSLFPALYEAYTSTKKFNPDAVRASWDNLFSFSPDSFSFGEILFLLNDRQGFDISDNVDIINKLRTDINYELIPQYSYWSAGDLTINHIFHNNSRWLIIDPKAYPFGLPEIDLGRLSCQIEMFSNPWADTLPRMNTVLPEIAQAHTFALKTLAETIRQESEPSVNPNPFWKLGRARQYLIAATVRSGHRIPEMYKTGIDILESVYNQLAKH